MSTTSSPTIACDLSVFTGEERAHHIAESRALFALAFDRRETSQGIELRFSDEDGIVGRIAGWADRERRCCPFFRFSIEATSPGLPIALAIATSSPEQWREVRTFLVDP